MMWVFSMGPKRRSSGDVPAMFIVWGTKVVNKYRGRRAEYCPLCRDVQPFRRTQIETVGHLYYIPLGTRKFVGLFDACETCGLSHQVRQVSTDEGDSLVRSRRIDLESLVDQTHPTVRQRFASSLNLAERLRTRQAGPGDRRRAVIDTLVLADMLVGARTGATRFDRSSGLAFVGAIVAPILVIALGQRLGPAYGEQVGIAAIIAAGLCVIFMIYLMATDGRRYTRRVLQPIITKALAPLDPPVEELEEVIEGLKNNKMKISKYLEAKTLREALDGQTHLT